MYIKGKVRPRGRRLFYDENGLFILVITKNKIKYSKGYQYI